MISASCHLCARGVSRQKFGFTHDPADVGLAMVFMANCGLKISSTLNKDGLGLNYYYYKNPVKSKISIRAIIVIASMPLVGNYILKNSVLFY